MKTALKYLIFVLTGFCALVGLLVCGVAFFTFSSLKMNPLEPIPPRVCTGPACVQSEAGRYIPLPPQQEEGFPMALDCHAPCEYSGILVFRAPADWQETFRKFYATPTTPFPGFLDNALHHASQAEDKRLHDFISSRQWEPFHAATIVKARHSVYFHALRDASGEYLLVYIRRD